MKKLIFALFFWALMLNTSPIIAQVTDYTEYRKTLDLILEDDQKFRGKSKEKQAKLDELNRNRLDELYEKYGFPYKSKVERKRLVTAVLLLHHSEDCEWNRKWIPIFLDHFEEIKEFKVLLSYMFERTYGKEFGICESEVLFKELKVRYPSEIIQYFGIQ